MFKGIITAIVLGTAVFLIGAYALSLPPFDGPPVVPPDYPGRTGEDPKIDLTKLGDDLFPPTPFPARPMNVPLGAQHDQVTVAGHTTSLDVLEVPSQVPGQLLFIGEAVPDAAVQAAGVLPFLAEPYYTAVVRLGDKTQQIFYRRWYESEVVTSEQMLGMVDPAKAMGAMAEKRAKYKGAIADRDAAKASEKEAELRHQRALRLYNQKVINEEEYGSALVTMIKFKEEHVGKIAAVDVAQTDLDQAEILLRQHEIRNKLPYKRAVIKTILRQRGYAVKDLEPVMQLHSIDRLLAEALLEVQYVPRLREQMTATLEPTVEVPPAATLTGHRADVNAVAVSRDKDRPRILSASDDGTVFVWDQKGRRVVRVYDHGDPVQAVACAPASAARNWAVSGTSAGALFLWDLDADTNEPAAAPERKHGEAVTALAFSPDGAFVASGDTFGMIRLWKIGKEGDKVSLDEVYPFDAEHGVDRPHSGTITSLTFLPQCRLVSAARDNTVRVWQLKDKGAALDGKALTGREGAVGQLGASPDGRSLLFDQGRTLQLISVEDRRPIGTLRTPGAGTPFETLAIFSPDSTLMLTAGAPEGRLQLWRTPTESERSYEVRQFVTTERGAVTCAAFAPATADGGPSFAVSASKGLVYVWPVPSKQAVAEHRIENVRLTLKSSSVENPRQLRIGFEVPNQFSAEFPQGRLVPGRPVTIVIDE